MGLVLPPLEAYHVQHLPIVKAYADKIGLVEAINAVVPTEMGIDPGTIGRRSASCMRRWTLPSRAERGRVILSDSWTTSVCYKPREIERT